MGKLAERLADPKRSGVYRVETTEALEEAALPLAPLYNWLRKPKEETHGTDKTHPA